MSAKIWKGWGGCRFVANGITADFPGGVGNTIDKPIKIYKENDSYNLIPRIIGSRLTVTTKELYNIADNDYEKYENLAQILTYLFFQQGDIATGLIRTVTIYPRYDSTLGTNLNYECTLNSNITASDIARCKTGQVMDLEWIVLAKQDNIPTFISDTEGNNYADDSSNRYVDDSGNYYVDGLG